MSDVSLLLKVAGIGMIAAVICQILSKSGIDEQATLVSVAGIIIVLSMIAGRLSALFDSLRAIFGL